MVNPCLTREDLIARIDDTEKRLEWANDRIAVLTAQLNSAHGQISKLMRSSSRPDHDPDPPF